MLKNNIFIVFLLLVASKGFGGTYPDCSLPKNINECARIETAKYEKEYDRLVDPLAEMILKKRDKDYYNAFFTIEGEWYNFLIKQCDHVREAYGSGTIGRTNNIGCYSLGYELRTYFLKRAYYDILDDK